MQVLLDAITKNQNKNFDLVFIFMNNNVLYIQVGNINISDIYSGTDITDIIVPRVNSSKISVICDNSEIENISKYQ